MILIFLPFGPVIQLKSRQANKKHTTNHSLICSVFFIGLDVKNNN